YLWNRVLMVVDNTVKITIHPIIDINHSPTRFLVNPTSANDVGSQRKGSSNKIPARFGNDPQLLVGRLWEIVLQGSIEHGSTMLKVVRFKSTANVQNIHRRHAQF